MSKPERLASLDQFRGYTVVGMLLVNYFGNYKVCPQVLKHTHDYCSYADTIMPQFLFAVGFALRLSFGRRMQNQFSFDAYSRMIRRLLGLVLISLVVYQVAPRAANWHTRVSGFFDRLFIGRLPGYLSDVWKGMAFTCEYEVSENRFRLLNRFGVWQRSFHTACWSVPQGTMQLVYTGLI